MNKRHFAFAMAVLLGGAAAASAQDAVQHAQQLEQSGDLKGALAQYTAALQHTTGAKDKQLRETIIDLVLRLDPRPPVPEDAIKHGVRGETLAKAAQSEGDRAQAAAEFHAALKLAPWWADAYLDYGLLEEAMRQPREAIWAYTFYLRAAPQARDAEPVRRRIYAQEALAEKAAKDKATKADALTTTTSAPPPPPAPQYQSVGRIVEVYAQYGYVVFRVADGATPGPTVYVRVSGALRPLQVEKRSGNLISATVAADIGALAVGTEVLAQKE